MKIWDAKVAEIIAMDIAAGMPMKEAIVDGLIMELALPWNSTASVVEIYDTMMSYDAPETHEWAVADGVLFCDKVAVKRVGAKEHFTDDDASLYWEGLCLAKGEYID